MKRGVILYVTLGKDEVPLPAQRDLTEVAGSLGVAAVSVAVSEEDIAYAWWRLITEGVHQIVLMTAAYDASMKSFASHGEPVRLWG
jgi:hypothetical protein